MSQWQPSEVVSLIGVAVAGLLGLIGLIVWYRLRAREAELAGLSNEERAARMFGEALAHVHLSREAIEEITATFTGLGPEARRAFALALAGVVGHTDGDYEDGLGDKVLGVARGFSPNHRPAEKPRSA